jgi:hypothetical protein
METPPTLPAVTETKVTETKVVAAKVNSKNQNLLLGGAILGVVIAALILAGVILSRVTPTTQSNTQTTTPPSQTPTPDTSTIPAFAQQYASVCQDRDVSFTYSPIALNQLAYMIPLGQVADGHVTPTDHVYLTALGQNSVNSIDVVMPADGTVVNVSAMPDQYIGDRTDTQTAIEDHRIVIAHNCQYYSIFIHINQLSPAIQEVIGELAPNQSINTQIELKAGELIGKIGPNPVDWTFMDVTTTLTGFISPELYQGENWKIHTIDPTIVYTGDMKAQMEAKSLRSVEPIGGKIDYDEPGKLVGNWFQEGTNGYAGATMERYWDGHLAIAPNNIDPSVTIVSIGNWDDVARQYAVKGTVDPAAVNSETGPVKYELVAFNFVKSDGTQWFANGQAVGKGLQAKRETTVVGTIMFEVMAGEKLKVEKFIGKTATQVSGFTSAAVIYER